jgi:4-diphosphocytidyl-2-C-methyl-D-erythritol kinase
VIVFPNAKINLGLRVIRKRHDGFHDIESLFYPLSLRDVLEVLPVGEEKESFFRTSGLDVTADDTNLCMKALGELKSRYQFADVGICLHKTIPLGGGLGGGSSDAAFTLKVIDKLFKLKLSKKELLSLAGELGSDCPFFIDGRPMLVTGRGEIMDPAQAVLKGYYLLLVVPDIKINTSEAYEMITPNTEGERVQSIVQLSPENWRDRLLNHFEPPLFRKHPELSAIKERLYDSGAIYASMTGSGSAIYGIYNGAPEITSELKRYFVYREKLK